MSPTFNPCSGGVSNVIGGCVKVCLRPISQDSVGVDLRWISFGCSLRLCVYIFDLFNLRVTSTVLVRWSLRPWHDDFQLSTTTKFAKLQ